MYICYSPNREHRVETDIYMEACMYRTIGYFVLGKCPDRRAQYAG